MISLFHKYCQYKLFSVIFHVRVLRQGDKWTNELAKEKRFNSVTTIHKFVELSLKKDRKGGISVQICLVQILLFAIFLVFRFQYALHIVINFWKKHTFKQAQRCDNETHIVYM